MNVDPGWVSAYTDAFRAWPEAAVFGGPIEPVFEGCPPAWLAAAMDAGRIADAYARRDLGDKPIRLTPEGNMIPYGANYAIRMDAQRRFPYDPRLGLCGDDRITGEETNVVWRILGTGAEGRWVPAARIRHVIPKGRQTVAYIREYFVGGGRTAVRRQFIGDPAFRAHPPRGLGLAVAAAWLEYGVKRLTAPAPSWCPALDKASSRLGRLLEHRAIVRRAGLPGRARGASLKDPAEGCPG